jgi:hypothetical protein
MALKTRNKQVDPIEAGEKLADYLSGRRKDAKAMNLDLNNESELISGAFETEWEVIFWRHLALTGKYL